ncbi:NUT family member 2F [Plecturocebus cupreus]
MLRDTKPVRDLSLTHGLGDASYPVLGLGITKNPGTSMPVSKALPFATPAPSPAHGPPLMTALVPSGSPPVQSVFPSTPLVAGQDGRGLNWAGVSNVLVQMRTEVGPVKAPKAQTLVLTQAPLIWQAPENAGPWPQGAHAEGSLTPSQVKAPPDDSCNPKSMYENFQLWQHYKPLAWRHLPRSPDTEALSCFFMFLEFEAEEETQIQKSQWMKGPQCLPPPALPRLEPQGPPAPEVVKQPVYLPSKASPKAPPACLPPPRPQRPAETKAHLLPPRPQRPVETKAPEEMPPEVVEEYMNIMEELLGPPAGATGELKGQWEEGEVEQEGDGMLLDPGVLSYVENLCSQKDFITKLGWPEVLGSVAFQGVALAGGGRHSPPIPEELLSPDPQMDFFALCQELEQEEGLTLAQSHTLSLTGSPAASGFPACHQSALVSTTLGPAHTWGSASPSKSTAAQGAERYPRPPARGQHGNLPTLDGCPGPSGTRQSPHWHDQVQKPCYAFGEIGFPLAEGCPAKLSSPGSQTHPPEGFLGPSGTRKSVHWDGQVQTPCCAFGQIGFPQAEGYPAKLSSSGPQTKSPDGFPGPSGMRQRAQRDGQVQNPCCAFGEIGFPLAEGCPARLSSPGPSGTRQREQRDGQVQNLRRAFGETGVPLTEGCLARLSSPGPSGTRQRAQRDGQVQNPRCAFGETGFPLAEGCPARLSSPGPQTHLPRHGD